MNINSIISKSAILFIPIRVVVLFFVLFFVAILSFRRYFVYAKGKKYFWSTLFFSYLLPVSFVTILILIPLDSIWILFTGYEFPLNWFLFLKNPILIRFVKIIFDTAFAFLLTNSVMKFCTNVHFCSMFTDKELAEKFRMENKRSEFYKLAFLSGILIMLMIWKAR